MADLWPPARGGPALQGQSSGGRRGFSDGSPSVSQALKRADVSEYSNEYILEENSKMMIILQVFREYCEHFKNMIHFITFEADLVVSNITTDIPIAVKQD